MQEKKPDGTKLIEAAEFFVRLYRQKYPLNYCRLDDARQEVCAKLWENRNRFDETRCDPKRGIWFSEYARKIAFQAIREADVSEKLPVSLGVAAKHVPRKYVNVQDHCQRANNVDFEVSSAGHVLVKVSDDHYYKTTTFEPDYVTLDQEDKLARKELKAYLAENSDFLEKTLAKGIEGRQALKDYLDGKTLSHRKRTRLGQDIKRLRERVESGQFKLQKDMVDDALLG